MANNPAAWRVEGKVLDAENHQGQADLLVEVFDQGRSLDNRLGSALTDERGEFCVEFDERDLLHADDTGHSGGKEGVDGPDLFCRVRSASGDVIAQSEVRNGSSRREAFVIKIEVNSESLRGTLARERAVMAREGATVRSVAKRYYCCDAPDNSGRERLLEEAMGTLKRSNKDLADLSNDDTIAAGTKITIESGDKSQVSKTVLMRDVHHAQLARLGVSEKTTDVLVDHLNIKGLVGLAELDPRYLGRRFDELKKGRCVEESVIDQIAKADLYRWAYQAKTMARLRPEGTPVVSKSRLETSRAAQRKLAKTLTSQELGYRIPKFGFLEATFHNQKLLNVKALLKKSGICDLSKVGTLKLSHDMSIQRGLYLPEPRNLVDVGYLGWLEARFVSVNISTFSHTHIDSEDWPVNEAVLIATELDLSQRRIIIDKSIDNFIIIAERIIYGDGAVIEFEPTPIVSATEHSAAAGKGADYGSHNDGRDGGDGTDGLTGFTGNAGHRGPNVEVYTLELPGGLPDIHLDGQLGGRGGRGQRGGEGGDGARGVTGEGFVFCTKSPGDGGDGGDGGNGGMGGKGGNGGDGGSLTVGILAENESQVYSRASHIDIGGGARGEPGPLGLGGAGGKGGGKGINNWWELCADGDKGRDGDTGELAAEYPIHSDPNLAANGISEGHGDEEGHDGLLYPPVLYSQEEWDLLLNQPWVLRLDPNRSVPSLSGGEDRQYILVEGENFSTNDQVYVDGVPVTTTFLSDRTLRFEAEFDLDGGGHPVHVRQSDGGESNAVTLTILPRLNEVSATDVIPGQPVTLNGNGFSAGARISFEGYEIAASTVTSQVVTGFLPSQNQLFDANIGPGQHSIKIINPDGEESESLELDLAYPFSPRLVPVIVHRMFSEDDGTTGTNATEADIRDLFINSDLLAHRIGYTVNHVTSQAGIQFVLAEIRDQLIDDDQITMPFPAQNPGGMLRTLSSKFNVDGHLNIYMLVGFDVSFAWGVADGDPGEPGQTGAAWMPNLIDAGAGNNTRSNWRTYVNALTHEIGHFLTLPHLCAAIGGSRLNAACTATESDKIMNAIVGAGRNNFIDDEVDESRDRATSYVL